MNASDELQHRYRRLRQQLDAAYAAADWDSSRIDRITAQMAPIERQLSSLGLAFAADGGSPVGSAASQAQA